MGITAVEQIRNALTKHRLSGPTIFRVSCAIWGTSEIDSVSRHVDMLQTLEYDRCEQIKTLLTDYLAKLDGTDEQKIQKVAELFKDWDPEMKHELLRGVISADKASGQLNRKEKTPEQQKAQEKVPDVQKAKETPVQQKPKEKVTVQQKAEEKVPVQQKAEQKVPVQQEVKKEIVQQTKAEKDSDKPKEAVKDKTEKTEKTPDTTEKA